MRLLAHPLSLGALGLILVNDQVLRRWWPSWITGKLSDLAWLFVVPLVLAVLIAWILPQRRNHTVWIFGLAYALTGLGFILVKAVPPANLLVGRAFLTFSGLCPALSPDPSDLLALPGLFLSLAWCLYEPRQARPEQNLPLRWRLVVLPLAALVLLADAPAPDFGIQCFTREGNSIYAKTGYNSMVSTDGGLTWAYDNRSVDCSPNPAGFEGIAWREVPSPQEGQVYRILSGNPIQFSTDGGKTWQIVYQVGAESEAERAYVTKSRQGSPVYTPGPLDAIADPTTGNMLFAMGQQGVLVRKPGGEWVEAAAGAYQPVEGFPTTDAFVMMIGSTAVIAFGLVLLIAASLAMRWTAHWVRWAVLAIAWIGWATVDVLFPPAISESYALTITGLGMAATGLFLLPLVIEQIIRLTRRAPRAILPLLGFGLAGGLLYLIPYVLWLYNIIPAFATATGVALLPVALALAVGIFWVRAQRRKTAEAQTA